MAPTTRSYYSQEPPMTSGRHGFVILGTQRGGTRLHLTDDPMYKWSQNWGISTTTVTALCGQHTHNAFPATEDILKETENDGYLAVKKCPRCWKEN